MVTPPVWGLAPLTLLVALVMPAAAQPAREADERLRVHLDCACDGEFLRSEMPWVDFVREPQDADVQVLSSSNPTGGGGRELVLRFVGRERFADVRQESRVMSVAADPDDVTRRRVRDAISVVLLSLLGRDGRAGSLSVTVRDTAGGPRLRESDPWNSWAFRLSGEGALQSEETKRERSWEFEATADRVTERWKLSFRVGFEQQREQFDLDEDEPLEVVRRERQFDWFLAKSLGEHWSLGVDGDTESSTFDNVRFLASALPAVEFNLFPYSQYATRQLRVEYAVGVQQTRYNEVTLLGRLRETRGRHELSVTLDQRQPWGTVEAGAEWSQYLHDLARTRFEVQGSLTVRLARGLALEIEGSASRIRDQLFLPRRDATAEEVLLRLRQLQSGHEAEVSVGFTYSFGSLLNNIVNPRFGS